MADKQCTGLNCCRRNYCLRYEAYLNLVERGLPVDVEPFYEYNDICQYIITKRLSLRESIELLKIYANQ